MPPSPKRLDSDRCPPRTTRPIPTAKLDLFYGPGGGTLNDTGLSISNTGIITFASGRASAAANSICPIPPVQPLARLPSAASVSERFRFHLERFCRQLRRRRVHSTGEFNTGVGTDALFAIASGLTTPPWGYSLDSNNAGSSNTAAGAYSLLLNTSGATTAPSAKVRWESPTGAETTPPSD